MRQAFRRFALLSFVIIAAFVTPAPAWAQTIVPSGTVYSTNVTWAVSGSPYVVSSMRVAAGATLTIDPGVVVKMNGQLTMLTVNGQILANGTAASPIVITSVQDDSADGIDSGGDGATVGAPGQWYSINLDAAGSYPSSFDHVDVRYGGWGSVDYGYGALSVSAGTATVSNSRFHDNQRSAVYVYTPGEADISKTRFDHNANGASDMGGVVNISDSVIDHNSNTGLYYNLASTPSAQSLTYASRIADNAGRGVWFNVVSSVPGNKAPIAQRSNIFRNGTPNANGVYPEQLYVVQSGPRTDIDWSNNYWGTWGAGNPVNANPCSAAVSPKFPWHLAYGPYSTGGPTVSPGPVSFSTEVISWIYPGTFCGSDKVKDYPFSTKPYETQYIGIFSPLVEASIARGIRPYLKFDADERWTPLLLEPFFAERDGDEGAHKFCPDPGSTDNCTPLTSLAQFTSLAQADSDGFLNINDTEWGDAQYESLYVENGSCTPAWGTLRECGDTAHSAMYYNLTTVDGADGYQTARSYWDYWVFYRFNDADSTPWDHEGDWEGMTVVTPAALDPDVGPTDQVLYVVYAQHRGTYRNLPGSFPVDGGTHPVGYPANGTHATYPETCDSSCDNDDGKPEGDHDGAHFWSGNTCDSCLLGLPEVDFNPLASPQPAGWNALPNQWGSTFNGTLNDATSPDAPGNHDRYLTPWNATGGAAAPPPAFRRTQSRTEKPITCGQWFGGGVVALLCDAPAATAANRVGVLGGRHKGTYGIRLAQAHARYGSTFGLAQAVGRPLANRAHLRLTGRIPHGVLLQIRTPLRRKLASVTFRLPSLSGGARATLVRSGSLRKPAYTLMLANGRRLRPVSVRVPR
jgi:Right handed beta helix region